MDQTTAPQEVELPQPEERKRLLETINSPEDLRRLPVEKLPVLTRALREFMVESVSKTGGHLSSSLGAADLAVALHYVFNTPEDPIVWDVGHQAYAHKILTGRREAMATLRKSGGISGFPSRNESPYDSFGTAHSSTSISAALGMAVADAINGRKDRWHIAVIGDGALTGGMAVEALNHAGVYKKGVKLLIILNDNDHSISPPAGALSGHLAKLVSTAPVWKAREISKTILKPVPLLWEMAKRVEKQTVNFLSPPSSLFSSFDINYFGPIDGHDVVGLVGFLKNLKALDGPIVLHVKTRKGRGYKPAEDDPTLYHGVGKFDPKVGILPSAGTGKTYTQGLWNLKSAFPSATATWRSPSSTPSPLPQALPARACTRWWRFTRPLRSAPTIRSSTTWRSRTCPWSLPSTAAALSARTAEPIRGFSTLRSCAACPI